MSAVPSNFYARYIIKKIVNTMCAVSLDFFYIEAGHSIQAQGHTRWPNSSLLILAPKPRLHVFLRAAAF